ncbi:glycosyltransferase family 61 protein [Azospirillum sp.]|uniref:glycosyltransferase family 61 protein n=1 Tax=Azospirillum sp. TaxID=34012 RepID=UPI003D74D33D
MDFFEACDRLTEQAPACGDPAASWTDHLAGLALPALPRPVADHYTAHFAALYQRLGTGNLPRDTLCNIAAQCLHYVASPWEGVGEGAFLQVGGLGGSAFLAGAIGNWRVPAVFSLGWPMADLAQAQAQFERLNREIGVLEGQGAIGQAVALPVTAGDALDFCAGCNRPRLALLHVADAPDAERALAVLDELAGAMLPEGLVLVSGARPVVDAVQRAVAGRTVPGGLRRLDTVTVAADGTRREDALLAFATAPLPPPHRLLGSVYEARYADLVRRSPALRSVADWPVLSTPTDVEEGVWSAADGSTFPEAHCFASWELEPPGYPTRQNYADFPTGAALERARGRWRHAFGRVVSMPGGCVIGRMPMSADGTVPLECVNPYHLESAGVGFLSTGVPTDLPTTTLPGDWIWLPCASPALSHWLIEDFLPALTLLECGAAPNLLLQGPPTEYQRLYLTMAGFPPERWIVTEPNRIYRCGRILAPAREAADRMVRSMVRVHHPSAMKGVERMLGRAPGAVRPGTAKLYVSRLDSRRYRACLNEEAVVTHVQRRGYRVVNAAVLSPSGALQAYGEAGVIAGTLGAGVLNMVFAPPGCQVVSFMAPEYLEEHVEQLAHLVGQDYGYLGCPVFQADDPSEGGARNSNFLADIDRLDALLDLAEARAAARCWRD